MHMRERVDRALMNQMAKAEVPEPVAVEPEAAEEEPEEEKAVAEEEEEETEASASDEEDVAGEDCGVFRCARQVAHVPVRVARRV